MFDKVLILNPHVLDSLKADLQDAANDLKSGGRLRRLFEEIRDEVVIPSIATNFRVAGRPSWQALAPATLEWRQTHGVGGDKPLDHTGQMKRAAQAKARFTIRNNEMTYGNWPARRWWAPVHDFGSSDGRIPQRQFVAIQLEDADEIQRRTGDWVEDVINDNLKLRYA